MPKITLLVTGKRMEMLDEFGKPTYESPMRDGDEDEERKGKEEIVVDLIPVKGFGEIHIPKSVLGECEIGDKYSFEAPYRNMEKQGNGTNQQPSYS